MLIFTVPELKINAKYFLKIGKIDKDWWYRKYVLITNQYVHTARLETKVSQTVHTFTISQVHLCLF